MDEVVADAGTVERRSDVQAFRRWDERHLARLAAAHDGVVNLAHLDALGLTREARRRRIAQRRLIVLHRGVYAVGHDELTERGRFRAAVWAGGDGAFLSGRAGARLLGLWERAVAPEITVPKRRYPRLPGVTVHRTTVLSPRDRTHVRGIPCTSVSRTLVDLAASEAPPALEAAFERAERRGLIRPALVDEMVNNRPGAPALRALLATHKPRSARTRSLLERRLLAALRRAGLPEPVVNGHLDLGDGAIIEPDLMWPAQRVLVELDGLDAHGTRSAMRRDRRRDRRTLLAGWISLRFTWDDVEHELADVLADIRGAFAAR